MGIVNTTYGTKFVLFDSNTISRKGLIQKVQNFSRPGHFIKGWARIYLQAEISTSGDAGGTDPFLQFTNCASVCIFWHQKAQHQAHYVHCIEE